MGAENSHPAGAAYDQRWLAIYLNDHLAGATGGLELFRRVARAHRDTTFGPDLEQLTAEIAEDRASLLSIMQNLDVAPRRYKVWAGWLAEKAGRLKPNGRVVARSPLSSLIELEGLVIGVQAKTAGWRALRVLADADHRADPPVLDRLISRADRQAQVLDRMRLTVAAEILPPPGSTSPSNEGG